MSNQNTWTSVGKVAWGTARVVSGVLTATGHGLIGTYFRNHHMMWRAMYLGKLSVKEGLEKVEEGARELGIKLG